MRGEVWVYRFFDVAQEIHLDEVEGLFVHREAPVRRMRLLKVRPRSLEIKNLPVTVDLGEVEIPLRSRMLRGRIRARLYDFGVLSLVARITLPEDWDVEDVKRLAVELNEDEEDDPFERIFTNVRDDIVRSLAGALEGEGSPEYVHEFTLYVLPEWPKERDAAELLLGEAERLSEAMRREVLRHRVSYTDDAVIVTSVAAWTNDPEEAPDVGALLEFAHAQFLELRYYDDLLDSELTKLYEILENQRSWGFFSLRRHEEVMRYIMELLVETAEFTSRVRNAVKVTQDVYYLRLYQVALELLRVEEWSASIREKMEILERNYELLSDSYMTNRFMLIDTLILLLIFLEIVLGFFFLR
ncbi:MAG: hypothetical protein BLITH_1183 [Brockia lithotrophica]|uniref:DUF155 domain-containing protein n=1 Tax=Brockia lithotrophica TaxID=933949 RepID=A0A2T5G7P7_9BACL|nr:MAG: hypothetical protein BLITH_1183 [Brockia lithotrophica]